MLNNILCKIGLHKWKYVYQQYNDIFLDIPVIRQYKRFRICQRCRLAQESDKGISYFWWSTLSEIDQKILNQRIIDKGEYFILKNERLR